MRAFCLAMADVLMVIGALVCLVLLLGAVGAIDLRVCIASPSQCPTPATPSTPDPLMNPPGPVLALKPLCARFMRTHHLSGDHQ